MSVSWSKIFADRTSRMKASDIRELLKLTARPEVISLAGGLPAPELFPIDEYRQAFEWVLETNGSAALQYGPSEGFRPLREFLAQRMTRLGIPATTDEVLITNGSQQGLDLLGRVFIDRGDTLVVANPTYLGALQSFNYFGAKYATADSDDDGVIPEKLGETLARLKKAGTRPKFLYLVPTFANPTGTSIPEGRRKAILDLAHEHDLVIVEDDPYGKLRFDGDHIPSIYSMDKGEGRVIYLGTFSKILVPGFRLAWSVAPVEATRKLVISKQSVDLCTNAFTQYIAADLLAGGLIDRHLPDIISLYRRKRDIMLGAMERHFPKEGVHWTNSHGGLFTWATMPEHVNATEMLKAAIEREVAYVPGKSFFPDPKVGFNTMRMNFSYPADDRIKVGVERLGAVMAEWIAKKAKPLAA